MVKYFLIMLLMMPSISYASIYGDRKLEAIYGPNLTQAAFYLRFSFLHEYNKDWSESTFAERRQFLTNYEGNLKAERKKAQADAKNAAALTREKALEARAEVRAERAKERAKEQELKDERLAEKIRQKQFETAEHDQEKTLELLQREAANGGALQSQGLGSGQQSTAGSAQGSGQGSY